MSDILKKLDQVDPTTYRKQDADMIRSWQERIPKLMAQADFLKHPIVADLKEEITKRVEAINRELSNNPRLTSDDRMALFGEKRAHEFYLRQFSGNPEGELRTIERAIDLEL